MDVLEPGAQPPAILLQVDMSAARRSFLPDPTYSINTTTSTGLSRANVLGQSQDRNSVLKRSKSAMVSCSSCPPNCNASCGCSSINCDCSNASGSADLANGIAKEDGPITRSLRKKGKKKGKQHKKPFSLSSDATAALEEGVCSTSLFECCTNNGPACGGDRLFLSSFPRSAKAFGVSLDLSVTPTSSSYSGEEDESDIRDSFSRDYSGEDFNHLSSNGGSMNLINSASTIHTNNGIVSKFGGEVDDGCPKQTGIQDDTFGFFSDECVAPRLGSFSECWKSDDSSSNGTDNGVEPCIREDDGFAFLDGKIVPECGSYCPKLHDVKASKNIVTHRTSNAANEMLNSSIPQSKVVSNAHNHTDRSRGGGQGCSSNDFHPVKRGRQDRKLLGSSTGLWRFSNGGNMSGRSGKENSHSVWQKVQKNEIEECSCEAMNRNIRSQFSGSKEIPLCLRHHKFVSPTKNDCEKRIQSVCLDEIPGQTDVLERDSSFLNLDVLSSKSEDNLRNKVSEKVKRKPSLGSKQEHYQNSRKVPPGKTNLIRSPKISAQQKKALEIQKPLIHNKSTGDGLRSPSADSRRVGISLMSRVSWRPSEPLRGGQIHFEEIEFTGSVCPAVSDTTVQARQNLISPSSRTSDSVQQRHLDLHSGVNSKSRNDLTGFPLLPMFNDDGKGSAKPEIEVSHPECGKHDHFSGSVSQKWIPVGRKDAEVLGTFGIGNSSTSQLEEAVADGWNLKDIEKDQLNSSSQHLGPLGSAGLGCSSPRSVSVNFPSVDAVEQTGKLRYLGSLSVSEHQNGTHPSVDCRFTHTEKCKSLPSFETDLDEIVQVVYDAYRLQIESESVQLATGSPLAEFERLLRCASPVVAETNVRHCQTCSVDQHMGNSLCRHQIPNISLESIWQWYEGPGSYGLEVKAEDYRNSKRMGRDCFEFRAYFVPFLSAVQFFGHSRSSICCNDVKLNSDVNIPSDNSSHFASLPIFSILMPRSQRDESTSLSVSVNSLSTSYSSAASGDSECSDQSVTGICHGDSELLFEYFESEQPQQRRPLFEKIKELIRGDATSSCKMFGDPSKLDCLRLHDLHPSSWYSVAWYPIYRIPEGNFRAAFLTYHSLGHFIRRSFSPETHGGDTCIVSPAVGLQSYNAQAECWFQTRNSMTIPADENPSFNPSEILRERLRTLEQTASVMARASVCKGNQKSTNRQPDYEFFISRRR